MTVMGQNVDPGSLKEKGEETCQVHISHMRRLGVTFG